MKGTIFAVAMSVMAFVSPVAAQQNCAPREVVVEELANQYGETRSAIGLAKDYLMEVFRSQETGTWTITITHPNGIMCLAASGQSFEELDEIISDDEGDPT